MKIEEVGIYLNNIANLGFTYDCCHDYLEPLCQAIVENEQIARKVATLSNTHKKFLELIQTDEGALEIITYCLRWSSCVSILACSQLNSIRMIAVQKSQFIGLQLINDPDPMVRGECARCQNVCAEKLIHDPHQFVRSICASLKEFFALQLVNDSHEMVRVACTKWRSCAETYIFDENLRVRTRSVYRHPDLAELFINDSDPEVRKYCAEVSEACSRKLMNDPDWRVRITILHKLQDTAIYFQDDENETVRAVAARYLKSVNQAE